MARHGRRLLLHRLGRTLAFAAVTVLLFAAAERTVWDGIYSSAQAQRGKETYQTFCASCHMDDLSGGGHFDCVEAPALKGEDFMEPRELGGVFEWIKDHMPPDDPPSVSGQAKLDVLAYIFQQNGVPAGQAELDLNTDLKSIRITRKP